MENNENKENREYIQAQTPVFMPEQPEMILKHSGPGIASFILSLVTIIGYIACVAIIGAIISPYMGPDGMLDLPNVEDIQGITLAIFLFLLLIVINVIGLILGIVGVAIKNRKKVFSIIGLVINAIIVLVFGIFLVLTIAAAGSL